MPNPRKVGRGLAGALERAIKESEPAVSRIDMNYKDVTKRVPELTEAANRIKSGDMTPEQYADLVKRVKPVTPYDFVPKPATPEEAIEALTSNKKPMYGKTSEIQAGEQADLRLDIPSYSQHGVWVNSIHRKDAPTVYGSVSAVKNATMIGAPDKALKVATGETPKAPFAVIRGEWNPMDEATAVKNAQKYLKDKNWRQVGYDPERHGYFYDRETMAPVVGAEEVIQIGPLVLAKKPKFGDPKDFPFKRGGLAGFAAGGSAVNRTGEIPMRSFAKGGKAGSKLAKAIEAAGKEADAAISASKLEEILKSKQAPMTTPHGTGLPLMPRDQGMYTPREQKNLPRMPKVDKARAEGKAPEYTPRMQDLLDSPTARKKVNSLIEKGEALGMREWYGTEPLRQVAMDVGLSPREFEQFMAQMASASQRNPVDQQNKMGSYLWHLSRTGQLPEDAYLLTNKIRRGGLEAPEGTAIEFPSGYGSLAQGDIFTRGKRIASDDIEGALPPERKLGTFYENLMGNLEPVTVDVNAVRGPVIERGDPRWLTSKLVEKDEAGNVINSYKPREMLASGEMSLKQAKERPGFWEAAPSGSEYAGFEDLWQRAAKRHGIRPAEAQALGWYGSADVTALKTKPELYIDNLERMIRETAEKTGQDPMKVMRDVLKGSQYLKKDGGKIEKAERISAFSTPEEAEKYKEELISVMRKADGGSIKKMQWRSNPVAQKMAQGGVPNLGPADEHTMPDSSDAGRMNYEPGYAGGGWAKAGKAIAKAAQEAGVAKPVTAEKDLTTLQDFRTSLGDSIRARALEAQKQMDSFDYKYDKGQRVFTKDSAAKNKAPYTIVRRTRVGNRPMTEDGTIMGKKIIDPETGKAKRTPYEPGYVVRYENGDEWSEFDIPASAILGDVEMARGGAVGYDEGGAAKSPEEMLTMPQNGDKSRARLIMEILARMAKDQAGEEVKSLEKPRAATDLINKGMIAGALGMPVDIINMGLEGVDALRGLTSGKPVENRLASDEPFLGSDQLKRLMERYGMATGEERPMMETALSLFSPTGAVKGAAKTAEVLPKAARSIEGGLNAATSAVARPFTPATVTMEAVAPDLAKFKPRQWQETATRRLTGEGAPVSMDVLGGRKTTKRPGQGVYLNDPDEFGIRQLETNPLVAVDVPRAGSLSANKPLRKDVAQAGMELGQESVAAHRFLPIATQNIADASSMLIKPKKGSISNEEVAALGRELPHMIVAHNPRLGGVVIVPFETKAGKVPTEFMDAQEVASRVLGNRAKFTYGKTDPEKDLMYIPRSEYISEGATAPSASSKAMRERLKKAERRLFRQPETATAATP